MSELESFTPDLVLMDIEMPGGIDGIETTRIIRKSEKELGKKHIPVVGMSAYSHREIIEKSKEAGMDDYITKPVNFRRLQEIINKLMAGKELNMRTDLVSNDEELLDLDKIISAVGFDPEFLEELIKNYIDSSADYFRCLKDGRDKKDLAELAKYSHSFAGSSLTIGAKKIGTVCRAIEDAAIKGNMEKADALFKDLEIEYKQVIAYCRKLNFRQGSVRSGKRQN